MSNKIELRGIVTDALIGMISSVVEMSPPAGAPIPPFIQSAIDRAVERIASAIAQQSAAVVPVAQEPVAWMLCDESPSVTVSGVELEDWRYQGGVIRPLYIAPPAAEQPECGCCGQTGPCDPDCDCAEQPYSTTSDKYRADLYDEVLSQARLIGFGNVANALAELERRLAAEREQPDTVKVPRELLRRAAMELEAHMCTGCHESVCCAPETFAAAKEIDALLSREGE